MNHKRIFFAVLTFASALLAGCGSTIPSLKPYHVEVQQGNVVDEKMMAQLHPGMTKSQVRYILGTPLIQDDFHQNRWDYFYQIRKEGKVVDRRSIILDFEGDALKGIRGDVIPAGSAIASDDAPMAKLSAESKLAPKQVEEQGFWDHLKFWGDDEKPAAKLESTKSKIESKPTDSKPEESKKGFWNRLKFWESDDKPAPKADKSSDAGVVLITKTLFAHQLLTTSIVASEVADVAQQKEEVIAAVNAWADAWRKKDVKGYLAAYADKFMPEGFSSKKAWAAQRKQRILQAGEIKLELESLNVELTDQLATATFDQNYSTSKFSDQVAKTLQLAYSDNHWLIVKEFSGDVAIKSAKKTIEANADLSSLPNETHPNVEAKVVVPGVSLSEPVPPVETKTEATKTDGAKSEINSANSEPNIFERMLEKIGF